MHADLLEQTLRSGTSSCLHGLVVWPQPSSRSPSRIYTCACIAPSIVGKDRVLTETESALVTLVRQRMKNALRRSKRLVPKHWLFHVMPVRYRRTRKGSRGRLIASYSQILRRVRSQIIESTFIAQRRYRICRSARLGMRT